MKRTTTVGPNTRVRYTEIARKFRELQKRKPDKYPTVGKLHRRKLQ